MKRISTSRPRFLKLSLIATLILLVFFFLIGRVSKTIENKTLIGDYFVEEKSFDEDFDEILEDIQYQLEHLFSENFLFYTTIEQLKNYTRYLHAIEVRIDKALINYDREIESINDINDNTADYYDLLNKYGYAFSYFKHPETLDYRIMFEEWRVSLFAQQLKTARPVSTKRLNTLWATIIQSTY